LGESQVRLLLETGGLPPSWNLTIIEWLKEKEQEAQRRKEQAQNEQYQISLSSKKSGLDCCVRCNSSHCHWCNWRSCYMARLEMAAPIGSLPRI
jgi:hypothetical protein